MIGSVRQELNQKKKLLLLAENAAIISGNNQRVKELKSEINVLLDREARMWAQRSRLLWASQGDKNTKYFHSRATKRFKRNHIGGIRDEHGVWRLQPDEVSEVIIDHYRDLFSSSRTDSSLSVLNHVPQVISEEMNSSLTREFKEEEVLATLKRMAPLKAPVPDGMPLLFYQHFWSTVDKDVTSSVLAWFNTGILPHPLNHTFVTLIPKTKNLEYVHQFRPISLCNVLYKIFSKVLANRLKTMLPTIVTEHQSAFTKDRLISDNILVAFETLHCM